MSEEPNYPVIELQAENERLKDEIIQLQKNKIEYLEKQIAYLESLVLRKSDDEKDAGSHMIAPPSFQFKPKIRTMSEVIARLEERSRNAAEGKKSFEEINNEVKSPTA